MNQYIWQISLKQKIDRTNEWKDLIEKTAAKNW